MKKVFSFLFAILILISPVFSHSGRTDSNGGHNGPGGYHYHHGYPEHQHINGVCPYDFDDRTGDSSGAFGNSSTPPRIGYSDTTFSKPQGQNKSLLQRVSKATSIVILFLLTVLYMSALFPAIKLLCKSFMNAIRNKRNKK